MREAVTLTGMILSSAPAGEYDKRIVLLTRERGKITAFARGARRPNSSLLASTGVFVFGQFLLYEGRDAYNLVQANISNYFPELMSDFSGAYYGMYFCELADYYTKENSDGFQILKLLYQSLRALTKKNLARELVRYIFELKIFVCAGEYPEVFECTICRSAERLSGFSMKHSGVVCSQCQKAERDIIALNESTVYTMQYVVSREIERLYTFTVSEEVLSEFRMIMDRWRTRYIEKKLKTLEILESVKDIC